MNPLRLSDPVAATAVGASAMSDDQHSAAAELASVVGVLYDATSEVAQDVDEMPGQLQEHIRSLRRASVKLNDYVEQRDRRLPHDTPTQVAIIIGRCWLLLQHDQTHLFGHLERQLALIHDMGERCRRLLDQLGSDTGMRVASDVTGEAAATPATILVVDDNEDIREILRDALRPRGHDVHVAQNVDEAISCLETESVDLVLLDIRLGKQQCDGVEALKRIRRDSRWRNIPVVMVSGINDESTVCQCVSLGADDYHLKPISFGLLFARIDACLEKRRLRKQQEQHKLELKKAKARDDEILNSLFPEAKIQELKTYGTIRPMRYDGIAVMFVDIVGFTSFCEDRDPTEVVDTAEGLFGRFHEVAMANAVEKIRTIGDCFLATAGMFSPLSNPVANCVRCGQEMLKAVEQSPTALNVRIGIHYGSVIAGLAGRRKYQFDLWGSTVNTAARVEHAGVPGRVILSDTAWQQVEDICHGESLGDAKLKGVSRPVELVLFKGFLENGE